MTEIIFAESDWIAVRSHVLPCDVERCAVLLTSPAMLSDGRRRLLVRSVEIPSERDYLSRSSSNAELSPSLVARVSKKARLEGLGLVFVHSHPGSAAPTFSKVDDAGETHLAEFLTRRNPAQIHSALVVSEGGLRARILGGAEEISVLSVGEKREVLFAPGKIVDSKPDQFDRQVRAFGAEGQHKLSQLKVAIVGLGGTGSIVAEQLAHLGVRNFFLIDPDVIETTNLNRVVGANIGTVGRPKVDVATENIRKISKESNVVSVAANIIYAKHARNLIDADVIFGCTDSHGSRAVLQQIAYQYLIPCIDMGSVIATKAGSVTGIFGRVQLLSPGLACFTCSGLLDYAEVRRDMMTDAERKTDPYLQEGREPAPSVISLNSTVASMAVTMLLSIVAGIPSRGRYIIYNAVGPTLRAVKSTCAADCYICSKTGALARGDTRPLQARQD